MLANQEREHNKTLQLLATTESKVVGLSRWEWMLVILAVIWYIDMKVLNPQKFVTYSDN
jgi:hypothetical protein